MCVPSPDLVPISFFLPQFCNFGGSNRVPLPDPKYDRLTLNTTRVSRQSRSSETFHRFFGWRRQFLTIYQQRLCEYTSLGTVTEFFGVVMAIEVCGEQQVKWNTYNKKFAAVIISA
jgi:hypothetical protein